jgi:uncharacterized protein (DUF1778 family)
MPAPRNPKYTLVQVRVTPAYDAAIRHAAEQDESTIVDFCRAAIRDALRKRGLDPAKFRDHGEARA